jgi:magnesium transporter
MVQELVHEDLVARLRALSAEREPALTERELRDMLARFDNRDVAEALFDISDAELADLLAQLSDDTVADLVAELQPIEGASLLLRLTRVRAADVLEEMDPDDAADIVMAVSEVDEEIAEDLLEEMDPEDAGEVRELLHYPEESAGGIMTTSVVTVRPQATVEQTLNRVRNLGSEERTETIYYLYVTDEKEKLLGVLSLRELVLAPPRAAVGSIMRAHFAAVRPEADQEQVANLITAKNLLALPVVDEGGRLLGIVTADDVADVLEEEATEDIQHLGGSQPLDVPYPRAGVVHLVRKRAGWLLLLFAAQMYTGSVLSAFEDELTAVVALTFFIPLLIGTGGNVGSQVVTTIVRAQALGEVSLADIGGILWKELRVAALMACLVGVAAFVRAWVLDVDLDVQLTVAVSVVMIVGWAATVGAILPLVLSKFRIDPAVVSAPFITTLVDGTGLLIYFEVAKLFLF